MLPVCLDNIFFASWNKVGWNENRIRLPGSSGVFSTCCGSWIWSGTRTCLVRSPRSFRGRSICSFLSSAFPVSGSDRLLMSGAYMSVERGAVVKGFSTSITGESAFGSLFVVRFQVTIKDRFVWKLLITAVAFIRFLTSMGTYMSLRFPEREKVFPQVWQRCSLRVFFAGGSPSPDWISYN